MGVSRVIDLFWLSLSSHPTYAIIVSKTPDLQRGKWVRKWVDAWLDLLFTPQLEIQGLYILCVISMAIQVYIFKPVFCSITQITLCTFLFQMWHINIAHEYCWTKSVKKCFCCNCVWCRFESSMTTPTCLSAVSQTSLATSGSPPSEMSAPLSSLAISVPSVALSPSAEEERPLLLSNTCQPHKSSNQDEQKRTSVHYNHGHVADSLPPSPLFMENGDHQIIGDHDATPASHIFSALSEKLLNTNNNINDSSTKRAGVTNGHLPHDVESSGDRMLVSETEEPQGEHNPFLTTDSTTTLLLRAMYSSRTNPASPNDDLQVKSSSTTTKHDPITV